MKKLTKILYLVVLLPLTIPLSAKQPRAFLLGGGHTNMSDNSWHTDKKGLRSGTFGYVHNLFGLYIDGSYSAMFTSVPNTDFRPGGVALGGGLCYEHQRGMFKLQIGLGVRYQAVRNNVADTTIINSYVKDAWGYPYTLRYNFCDRIDEAWSLHTQLPVLFGLGVRGWYFLTGVKVNYTLLGSSSVSCLGTTTGTYPQFLGTFQEMDNHGLRKEVGIHRDGPKLNLKVDALLSFETGYEFHNDIYQGSRSSLLNSKPGEHLEYRIRIAAFVDYGILNSCPKTNKDFVDIPEDYKWDFDRFTMSHVFSTSLANPYNVHNFYVGIKITALIGTYSYKRCMLCQDFESEATMNTRGNKGK